MRNKKEQHVQLLEMITNWPNWQQSGLLQKGFYLANIYYHVFQYWYKVNKSKQNAHISFLPVNIKLVAGQEQITITRLNGYRSGFHFAIRLPDSLNVKITSSR